MARASTAAENQALDTTGWAYISLHSDDPGTTGANEVAGGSYARVAITWGSPSGGVVANSAALTVNVPTGVTVTHIGIWSASTGGTYYIGGVLSPTVTGGTVPIAVGGLTVAAS